MSERTGPHFPIVCTLDMTPLPTIGPSTVVASLLSPCGVVVGALVHVPGQHAARGVVSGVQTGGGGGGAMGGGGGAPHPPQVMQTRIPAFLSGLLSAEFHHFDGWQRWGDVLLVADSQTQGLAQPARWSVVTRQAEQLFAGTGSTQHATLLPPSMQAWTSGSSSARNTRPMAIIVQRHVQQPSARKLDASVPEII